jgi:hypothetical protein
MRSSCVHRAPPAVLLRSLLEDAGLEDDWDEFVSNEFRRAMDSQHSMAGDAASVYSESNAGVRVLLLRIIFGLMVHSSLVCRGARITTMPYLTSIMLSRPYLVIVDLTAP